MSVVSLWLWILAQSSAEDVDPTQAERWLAQLDNMPVVGWFIAAFTILVIATTAVATVTGNLDKIFGFFNAYRPKKREFSEADYQRLRQQLIDVMLPQVVKRLEDSLHHKIRLDLKREEQRQRVGRRDLPPLNVMPDSDAVLKRQYRFQPTDRLRLIQTLNALPSVKFEELEFALQPPPGQVPGSSASQGNRSKAFLEWVESVDGPGLKKLQEIFEMIGIAPSQSADKSIDDEVNSADTSTYDLLKRENISGRLLILGEPGAGKTNELLALAKTLLQEAQQSSDAPIPVIFELSEWSVGKGQQPLEDWLGEQLEEKYNVPHRVSTRWIKQGQLFPLLDGLDELRRVDVDQSTSSEELDRERQAKQIQCIRTINTFLDVHPSTSLMVCCRRKEYEALETLGESLKRLNGAIYLQALDDRQIKQYLQSSNRESLWDALNQQPNLRALARSPLFLLMLVVAYQGQPIQGTDELLDLYIEKQL
ncbi:MAG: NACHT domain-containing protein, partial [Cyanobacteria bacterium J06626_14]